MKKPADLVYGVEDRPPFTVAIVIALQHVLAIAVNLVYPLVLAREAGLSTETAADMLRIGMVALAVGTVLQAIPRGPIGCHYLAPMVYASPYLAPGFLAIEMGGMPLFWGMTIVAGLSLLVFAAVWDRLRTFIPPESAGLVVFLVGATIGVAALRLLHQKDGSITTGDAWIALLTLAVIIALNVWSKGRLRLFSVLIGLVVGYVIAAVTGVMEADKLHSIAGLPLLALPDVGHMAWSFRRQAHHPLCGDGACHRNDLDRDRRELPAHHRCGLGAAGHALDQQRHPRRRREHGLRRAGVLLRCRHRPRQCRPGRGHRRGQPRDRLPDRRRSFCSPPSCRRLPAY